MSSETEIRKLEEERLNAMLEGDAATLEELMADGSLYIHTSGEVDTKAIFVEKVRSKTLDYKTIDNQIEQVSIAGDIALICGILDISLLRAGTPASIHIRYLTTWSTGPKPQFISFQATPIPL